MVMMPSVVDEVEIQHVHVGEYASDEQCNKSLFPLLRNDTVREHTAADVTSRQMGDEHRQDYERKPAIGRVFIWC